MTIGEVRAADRHTVVRFQCSVCSTQFVRSEHLRRHMSSHEESREYSCSFCLMNFGRRDALLRHFRTCRVRISYGSSIPAIKQQKRGRKRASCLECSQKKKKCSRSIPCDNCSQANQLCKYVDSREAESPLAAFADSNSYTDGLTDSWQTDDGKSLCPAAGDSFWGSFAGLEAVPSATSHLLPSALGSLPLFPRADSESDGVIPEEQWLDPFLEDNSTWTVPVDMNSLLGTSPADPEPPGSVIERDSMSRQTSVTWALPSHPAPHTTGPPPRLPNLRGDLSPFVLGLLSKPTFECKFEFLAHFTATSGFADAFNCGTRNERMRSMYALIGANKHASLDDGTGPASSMTSSASRQAGDRFGSRPTPFSSQEAGKQGTTFHWVKKIATPQPSLARKSHEIIEGIRDTIRRRSPAGSGSLLWSSTDEDACCRFFSPSNLDKYLAAFWTAWYPNWPVFHKPTFLMAQKPASLLAAMALIGASLSFNKNDNDRAPIWVEVVEEWVFSAPEFCEEDISSPDDQPNEARIKARLDALRAAYAIVLIMTWEGTPRQKNRARRDRFTQTIAVARSLMRLSLTHGDLGSYTASDDMVASWRTFIFKEEVIRTLLYVIALDSAYVMFNNAAPRMVISELDIVMSCPEVCFQSSDICTWHLCMETWAASRIGKVQPRLNSLIEQLSSEHISPAFWTMLQQMSVLNFFMVANTFHKLVFNYRCGTLQLFGATPILRGLTNWKKAWLTRKSVLGEHEIYAVSPDDAWKRVGFMRYVLEFWALAWVVCCQSLAKEGNTTDLANHQRSGSAPTRPILEHFDDATMSQVHDLIVRIKSVDLTEGGL